MRDRAWLAAWLVVSLIGGLAAGSAWGEGGEAGASPPELATDRPDFTETSVVVPRGSLQLESGFTWEDGAEGMRTLSGPELLLRWGIGRRTELRIGLPDYIRVRGGGERASGFGDAYLGFKQQLGPTRSGFGLALIPGVSLPTGAQRLTSDAVDPEAVLTWSRDLKEPWSVGGIIGLFWPTEEGERNFTWVPTVSLARSVGGPWGTFLEYAGELPERGDDVHLLHHGYTYALTATSQADLHFGFGLSRAAPDFFIGGGYSARY